MYHKAAPKFTQAIKMKPELFKKVGLKRASCYLKLKEFVKAEEDIRQVSTTPIFLIL